MTASPAPGRQLPSRLLPVLCLGVAHIAFALVLIGVVGMLAHFWLEDYGGMTWSAIAFL